MRGHDDLDGFRGAVPGKQHSRLGAKAIADEVKKTNDLLQERARDAGISKLKKRSLCRQFARELPCRDATAEERCVAAKKEPFAAQQVERFFMFRPGHGVVQLEIERRE